jgi:hypothetical protein
MIRIGKNKRNMKQTCPSATMTTTNPKEIGLGLNQDLSSKKPVTQPRFHFMQEHIKSVTVF